MFTFYRGLGLKNTTFYELWLRWDCVNFKYLAGLYSPDSQSYSNLGISVKVFYRCD